MLPTGKLFIVGIEQMVQFFPHKVLKWYISIDQFFCDLKTSDGIYILAYVEESFAFI